ncbi:macrophage colony-stimulating factor 1 receptor 2 isoform X1 [Synchiropus splendidus]|uniref:macrophage colony-stimulating factor 1 receptor 2 isoform X1 n=1 Tax=Synchiropus splendidus TaxID=270530 RepID=UPI00237D779C|nr:macrophage colony-stimulating factor 1 receptor 2 isoform X1 [Synchiropus splendidus]
MLLFLLLLQGIICCCAQVPGPPIIYVNSNLVQNQTEVSLASGSSVTISCLGNESVKWSSTAILPLYRSELQNVATVRRSIPKHTGTYRCGYTNQSLQDLSTWVHLYIRDPKFAFVTPSASVTVKEGHDALLRCLVTDPAVKNLTLHYHGDTGPQSLPPGMNMTLDPKRGALIHQVQKSFKGYYVCSGWKDGMLFSSSHLELSVKPSLCPRPTLTVTQLEYVHLEGERFQVTCQTDNRLHSSIAVWTYPSPEAVEITRSQRYSSHLNITVTLTVASVTSLHSGNYTCSAENECGVATATVQLKVIAHLYLRMYLRQHANTRTIEVANNSDTTEMKVPLEVNGSRNMGDALIVNISRSPHNNASINGSSKVEVFEDRDLTVTFIMEAYPLITSHRWTTPNHVNNNKSTVYQQSYTASGYRSEASLVLRRVRQEERGRYSFHFSNAFLSGVHHIDLRIYRSPKADITVENDTLTCSSFGYPSPTVLWFTCPGVQETCADVPDRQVPRTHVTSNHEHDHVKTRLSLPAGDDVTMECVAYNAVGESRGVFVPRKTNVLFTPVLMAAVSLAAIFLLLLLVVSYKWKQKPKYEIRWKIIERTDGNTYTFVDPTELPYNEKWEFPRDKLRLGAVLGSGAFGKVVEATAYGLGTSTATRVAVKMLKPSAHSEEREALMSELKILSHLGYHDNIVNLLGACTQGGPMLMITEYCCHGDLLNFLRGHARDFVASFLRADEAEEPTGYKNMATQMIRLRSDSGISCCSEYQEMQPILGPSFKQPGDQTDSLSVTDLMRFSHQVAQGLDFLSTRNCIHRDVAARNVLLTDHHVAKICDFGLARDIRNDDSYIVQGNSRLPVKWMAPESIFQCIYTVQSDVWSYGVLLWEIFSLGKSPYPNMAVDTNFYKMIKDGRHMEQPDFAPAQMYQLMTLCWSSEPTDRPTFQMIGQLIDRLLPSTSDTSPRQQHQATYKNIDECREEEEQEDVRGQEPVKDCHDEDEVEAPDRATSRKNIYQLS